MRIAPVLSRESTVAATALFGACLIGVLAASNSTAAIAVPLMLAGGILLFARPVVGLLLFAALIPLEAAFMVGERSLAALIGMAVFGVWGAQKLLRREPLLPLVSLGLVQVACLLLAFAGLSLIWAEYPELVPRRVIMLFQLVLLCVLVFDLVSSWERAAWVAKFLVLAGTVAALITVEQYFGGGVRRAGGGVAGGINRTAVTLVSLLPFAFYLVRSSEPTRWRLLGLGYIGLAAIAIAATLSRMNYLLFPAVVALHMLLMARSQVGRRRVLLLGVVGVTVVTFLPMDTIRSRAESITPYMSETVGPRDDSDLSSARGYHLRMSLALFRESPIVGMGYDNYRMQFLTYQWQVPGNPRVRIRPQSPHNSHFAMLGNLGIIGFVLWMGLFVAAFRYVYSAWRRTRDPGSSQALLIQAVAIAIGLQFIYGLYAEVHQAKTFWLLMGLAGAMYVMVGKANAAALQDDRTRRVTGSVRGGDETSFFPRALHEPGGR